MVSDKEYNDWKEKAIELLKRNGDLKKSYHFVWILTAIFICLTFSGISFYLGYNGFLNDEINQNVNLEPQINATVNNDYQNTFDNDVNNQYTIVNNHSIYINNFGECG